MNRFEIILSALLLISLIFNVGVFTYARNVVAKLLFISEELGDLQNMINSFAKHLKDVYELEMFYGDETLKNLLEHAISFSEQLLTFEEIYTLTEEDNLDDNRAGHNDDDDSTETEEEASEA
tara:strand:+ start:340 stop:705 length:366 start_codon:yes stop_codon:yes gene_type:complete